MHAAPLPSRPAARAALALPASLQGGFSWIGFSLALMQARLRYQRYAAGLLFVAQAPALRAYCGDHFPAALGRCLGIGAFKICLLVLLPLGAVYWCEARARRLFLLRAGGGAELRYSPTWSGLRGSPDWSGSG